MSALRSPKAVPGKVRSGFPSGTASKQEVSLVPGNVRSGFPSGIAPVNRTKASACQTQLEIGFGGELVILDACGAIYLPERDTLIVSDLHLEKGSYFASRGNPIPCHDTRDTLARLADAIRCYRPARVVSLGDSFHDVRAGERIAPADARTLRRLVASVPDWIWVVGNHDPEIPRAFTGRIAGFVQAGPVRLAHQPGGAAMPVIAGHFHPKHVLRSTARPISARCFVLGAEILLMPAFGAYAGGLRSRDDAIAALFPDGARRHVLIYGDKLWRVD
jgi:DNA ligase-associated metallophosphoesterase